MRNVRFIYAGALGVTAALIAACSGGGGAPAVPQMPAGAGVQSVQSNAGEQSAWMRRANFHITALPHSFKPYAMMSDGEIAGSQGNWGAVYRHGQVVRLGSFYGDATVVAAVNRWGEGVGFAERTSTTPAQWHALLFDRGRIRDLGQPTPPPTIAAPLAYVRALTIDDRGRILGAAQDLFSTGFPILTQFAPGRTPQLLAFGIFPFDRGTPYRMNDNGEYAFTAIPAFASDVWRAYRGNGNTLTQIFPQYLWSSATWINDRGAITGGVNTTNSPAFVPQLAYVQDRRGIHYLPSLSGVNAMAPSGIDDAGDVSGDAAEPGGDNHIFFYRDGRLYDVTQSPQLRDAQYRTIPGISGDGEFVVCGAPGCRLVEFGSR